jgi:hypothetical protein
MATGMGGPSVSWKDGEAESRRASTVAGRLRDAGGLCDVSDVLATLFDVTLRDGRVFRRCGIHGAGGTLRGKKPRALEQARLQVFGDGRWESYKEIKIYLVLRWFGENAYYVPRKEIETIALAEAPAKEGGEE